MQAAVKTTCKTLPTISQPAKALPGSATERRNVATRPAGRGGWRCAAFFLIPTTAAMALAGCLTVSGQLRYERDGKTVTLSERGLGVSVQRAGLIGELLLPLPKKSEGYAK